MITFTIHGQAASKGNLPMLIPGKGGRRAGMVPSKEAQRFKRDCARFTPILDEPLVCDVKVTLSIFYQNRRSDLDGSLVYDCMQKKVIVNDRQVKEKHEIWGLDPDHPRVEVTVEPWQGPIFKEQ